MSILRAKAQDLSITSVARNRALMKDQGKRVAVLKTTVKLRVPKKVLAIRMLNNFFLNK
jgi:hypothetical protein